MGMESRGYCLWILLAMMQWPSTQSFAYWMENDYCDRSVAPGTVIMNEKAILSDEGHIRVFKGKNFDQEVFSGQHYFTSGEQLRVWLQLDGGEVEGGDEDAIFETKGGSFQAGGCGGRRTSRRGSVLQLPVFNEAYEEREGQSVHVWAGWASTHGEVRVSSVFSLQPATDYNVDVALLRENGLVPLPAQVYHADLALASHTTGSGTGIGAHSAATPFTSYAHGGVAGARAGARVREAGTIASPGSPRSGETSGSPTNSMRLSSLRGRVAGLAAAAEAGTGRGAGTGELSRSDGWSSLCTRVGVLLATVTVALLAHKYRKYFMRLDRKRHI